MKKAIVIAGGGSWGAYTAGRVVRAYKDYEVAVGSSTGALIAPFALLKDFETLKRCYTTTDNCDVFTRTPIYKNGIPKPMLALWAYLRGKRGITDSKPLRELIQRNYTEYHHARIRESGKELLVTVCELNARGNSAAYISSNNCDHKEMCDALWGSTLVPGLLETLIVEEQRYTDEGKTYSTKIEYADGGVTENCGLKKAIELGCTDIDVYLHDTQQTFTGYKETGKNFVHNLFRLIEIQRQEVVYNDLHFMVAQQERFINPVNINSIWMPERLEVNKMWFDKKLMLKWYGQGYLE